MALVMVVVFTFVSLMTMSATYEAIHQAYVLEKSADRIDAGTDGTERAIGIAVARLQSGIPETSPYTCIMRLRNSDGSSIEDFKVTHTELSQGAWTVYAEPTTDDLIRCPTDFTTECPLVIP